MPEEVETGAGKKKLASTYNGHWARPRNHTYEYNYQYSESYYQAQVNYLDKVKSTAKKVRASSVSSGAAGDFAESSYRLTRAGGPPKAQTFSERWAANPFYGRLGYRYALNRQEDSSEPEFSYLNWNSRAASSTKSRSMRATSSIASYRKSDQFARETSVQPNYRAASVSGDRRARAESVESDFGSFEKSRQFERESSVNRNYRESSVSADTQNYRSASVSADNRRTRASSEERDFGGDVSASVERARTMRAMMSCDSEKVSDYRFRRALSEPLTRRINEALAETAYVASGESIFPIKKSAGDYSYPLGIDAYTRRRFVLGDQYVDAAALGGFDVLYDPSSFARRRMLLKRIVEESTEEEISARSVREVSSRRQMASYQERATSVLR